MEAMLVGRVRERGEPGVASLLHVLDERGLARVALHTKHQLSEVPEGAINGVTGAKVEADVDVHDLRRMVP